MIDKLDLLLFDKTNNLIEEIRIKRPKTYYKLLDVMKINMKNLPNNFNIFYQKDNEKIIINNNQQYKLTKDILLIYEVDDNSDKSMFSIMYDNLPESKQEILDDKFSCNICEEKIKDIKNDKPLICYQCQKIYHKKCLEKWDNQCKLQKINFKCPKCKYELPLKHWKEKVNYEDERNNEVYIMNQLNKYNFNEDTKIINKYYNLKKKYKEFIENTSKILNNILNKINKIIYFINNNNKIKNYDNIGINNPNEISNIIFENIAIIDNFVQHQINNDFKKEKININNEMKIKSERNKNNLFVSDINEINCIYAKNFNETEINLIHDYSIDLNHYDENKNNIYLNNREINKKK